MHLCVHARLIAYVYAQLYIHYDDVIMGTITSQITSITIVYSTVYSGADQSKHQSSASLAFVWGVHRGLVNSPHKWPVTRKMCPFDDVIMTYIIPDSNVHGANVGPTWVPSAPDGPHVGSMNLVIRDTTHLLIIGMYTYWINAFWFFILISEYLMLERIIL